MLINLSPVRMDEELRVACEDETLMLNGETFDFRPLLEGATLPREAIVSQWFAGPVERVNGKVVLTLVLPHGANAPEETRFPQPITVMQDGLIPLPAYEMPAEPVDELPISQEPEE
ncbi:hypothetical protein E2H86_08615 [Pseudomonas putida]|uniref:hypothetical protein n=1 Tax=Pseudomonas putida TaxID=303 RepID=UPI0010592FE7|nr:hypothetical protein [Pseudomonas putida]TDJ77234.1 hypothetical protein E2H86_08615 [Pseudomonas putida]